METKEIQTITLGGGCFWCVEAVYQRLEGILGVESGYSNGHVSNPTYEQVCTKTTGHVEVLKIDFDPSVISLEEVLEVFWYTHDPTTLNRQGNDVGPQYRSGIYYRNEEQKEIAEKSKAEVATQMWDDPIVTEIEPLDNYYRAESYHQNYFNDNPGNGYCAVVVNGKVQKFRKKYVDRLKQEYR